MKTKLKLTDEQKEARRLLAAQMFRQGKRVREVARALEVAPSSACRWKAAFEKGGWEALKTKPHPGRKPRLNARQRHRLMGILLDGPTKAGYANALWTCPRVAQVIERKFGVHYHPGHVWYLLRNLGWTCQMPERQAREGNEQEQERWRNEEWPRIKKGLAKKEPGSSWRTKPALCSNRLAVGRGPRRASRRSTRPGIGGIVSRPLGH